MQRAHTGARAQWKSRLLGRALAPRARHLSPRCWRLALRGPLSLPRRASLRRSVVASSLSGAPGFVVRLGVFGCAGARSRSLSFLQFGLVAPCCVLILGQVCPRNRTHTSLVNTRHTTLAPCAPNDRAEIGADIGHTLRSFNVAAAAPLALPLLLPATLGAKAAGLSYSAAAP